MHLCCKKCNAINTNLVYTTHIFTAAAVMGTIYLQLWTMHIYIYIECHVCKCVLSLRIGVCVSVIHPATMTSVRFHSGDAVESCTTRPAQAGSSWHARAAA